MGICPGQIIFIVSSVIYLNAQLPILLSSFVYTLTWVFFILNRDTNTTKSFDKNTILVKEKAPLSLVNEVCYSRVTLVTFSALNFILVNLRFLSGFIVFEQLLITSFGRDVFVLLCFAYLALQFITTKVPFYKLNLTLEYLYALSLFFVMSPILYLSASVYSFFFLLEVLGVLVVILFSSLVYVGTKKSLHSDYLAESVNPVPSKLITSLFTQFWVSFFSTVLLILFLMISLFI